MAGRKRQCATEPGRIFAVVPDWPDDGRRAALAYPNSGDATKESGVSGAVLATAAQFSQAAASWPASRLVEVWNSFAGLLPFVELKEV